MTEARNDHATALAADESGTTTVLAQARGQQARDMAALGRELEVPVLEDFALSQALARMPLGTQLPEPLFKALGTLLEFVFEQEARLGASPRREKPDAVP